MKISLRLLSKKQNASLRFVDTLPWGCILIRATQNLSGLVGSALVLLVVGSVVAFAQDDTRRDYQEESRQVYRLCRTFSDATRGELSALQPVLTSDELLDLL